MSSCDYSVIIKDSMRCGPAPRYSESVKYITLSECSKDITFHLKMFNINVDEEDAKNEMRLLLARAGKHCNIGF